MAQQEVSPLPRESANGSKLGSSDIYDILRSKILHHEISPATKIKVDGFARQLGVSPLLPPSIPAVIYPVTAGVSIGGTVPVHAQVLPTLILLTFVPAISTFLPSLFGLG